MKDGDGPVHGGVGTRGESTGNRSGAQPGMAVQRGTVVRTPDDRGQRKRFAGKDCWKLLRPTLPLLFAPIKGKSWSRVSVEKAAHSSPDGCAR